jgi:1-deoxy-D-xylulose-5-phosphate reductoisomerase
VRFLVGETSPETLIAESQPDLVVNGLVGAAGLRPTLAALERGIDVGLANKESLVIGGALIQRVLTQTRARLIPIDSEHSALFQLLQGRSSDEIVRVVLTASGGALRDWPLERLSKATPEDVLQHPTWQMGSRITVDSATLVNKALEVIEAHWLFALPYERIEAVIHPQSIVHGLVELCDGSWLAHLGTPDMRVPIQYALTYPWRAQQRCAPLDLVGLQLKFDSLEPKRYPAFGLIIEAGRRGSTYPAVANAADEVAVERFLRREIAFGDIPVLIEAVLNAHEPVPDERLDLAAVLAADRWAREQARRWEPP